MFKKIFNSTKSIPYSLKIYVQNLKYDRNSRIKFGFFSIAIYYLGYQFNDNYYRKHKGLKKI